MSLNVGTHLGSYEILGLVAGGGMGEVYRARDLRLGREVAVKVMAEGLQGDPNELARFRQEARLLASLSHPNILSIFDVGEEGGTRYAVMELLGGTTLRTRMGGRRLPWRTAVAIAEEVARGMAAAHLKGIVHRDLKPENIFLLAGGGVKILDFGLARRTGAGTVDEPELRDGTLVGTTLYMAPEQIYNHEVDARTDIFALGAVIHEMLTGDRPFGRTSIGGTMSAILNDPPGPLPSSVPGSLARVVRVCLEKDPSDRFQSAFDLAFALREVASPSTAGPDPVQRWRERLLWLAIGLVAGGALAVTAMLLR
jgi:serine/threonine protein kinase